MEPKGLLKRNADAEHEPPAPEPQRKPGGRSMTSRLGRGTEGDAVMTPGKRGLTDALPMNPAAIKAQIASERGGILTVGTTKYAALRATIAEKEQSGKRMFAAARSRLRGALQVQKLAIALDVARAAKQVHDDTASQQANLRAAAAAARALVAETAKAQALRIVISGRAAGERVYAEQQRSVQAAQSAGGDGSNVSQAGNGARRKLQADALADHEAMLARGAEVAAKISENERMFVEQDRGAIIAAVGDAGAALEERCAHQLEHELAGVAAAESAFDAQIGRLRQGAERVLSLSMRAAGMVTSFGDRNSNKLVGVSARFAAGLEQRIQATIARVDAAISSIDAQLGATVTTFGQSCQQERATLKTQLDDSLAHTSGQETRKLAAAKKEWSHDASTFTVEATSGADKAIKAHGELADKISEQLRSVFAKGYEFAAKYGEGVWNGIKSFALGLVICVVATIIFTALLASSFGIFAGLVATLIVLLLGAAISIGVRLYSLIKSWGDLTAGELLRGFVIALVAGLGDMLGLTGLLEATLGFDVVIGAVLSDEEKAEKVTTGVLSIGAIGLAKLGGRAKKAPSTKRPAGVKEASATPHEPVKPTETTQPKDAVEPEAKHSNEASPREGTRAAEETPQAQDPAARVEPGQPKNLQQIESRLDRPYNPKDDAAWRADGYEIHHKSGKIEIHRKVGNDREFAQVHVDNEGIVRRGPKESAGDSRVLERKMVEDKMGDKPADHQAHHKIPSQVYRDNPLFQYEREAALREGQPVYDPNGSSNGKYLPEALHKGSHKKYNAMIDHFANEELAEVLTSVENCDPANVTHEQFRAAIRRVEQRATDWLSKREMVK